MIAYLDASALVKRVVRESESDALASWLEQAGTLATSRLAVVEVERAAKVAEPGAEAVRRARRGLEACLLIDVSADVLGAAAGLASERLRSRDAIHLATALRLAPDVFVAYDQQLAQAASAHGLVVASPA